MRCGKSGRARWRSIPREELTEDIVNSCDGVLKLTRKGTDLANSLLGERIQPPANQGLRRGVD